MNHEHIARRFFELDTRAKEANRRRDEYVADLHSNGATLRDIGAAIGVSHAMVAKIIRRAHRA